MGNSKPSSLLLPGQFEALTQPGCNSAADYYECSHFAYENSFEYDYRTKELKEKPEGCGDAETIARCKSGDWLLKQSGAEK